MTVMDILASSHGGAVAYANLILGASLAIPMIGAIAARIGRGGETDEDGKAIGNALLLLVLLQMVLFGALTVGWTSVMEVSWAELPIAVLVAPIVALGTSMLSLRMVFPLGQLEMVRRAKSLGLLALVLAATVWFLSQFRGWGILFLGGLGELFCFGIVVCVVIYVLYRRALS